MNSSLKSLFQQLNENFNLEDPLAEDNSGNSGGEYQSPNAFSDHVEDPDDAAYSEKPPMAERFYRKIDDIYNRLAEASYNDFRNDDSKTERQKINGNIIEINRKLREVEQMIGHASKLKLETGQGSDVYWKATGRSFLKIKERLVRLTSKIVEISS